MLTDESDCQSGVGDVHSFTPFLGVLVESGQHGETWWEAELKDGIKGFWGTKEQRIMHFNNIWPVYQARLYGGGGACWGVEPPNKILISSPVVFQY